ncbi:gas vesicle protein GvpO [Nitriliruptor alkaliphilus]|uniref:gas vesicle protein GvpO n=1 Tax=Nitriliruptor alkaliphilus TaxID=427918 RepID=UPI00069800FF|nr:gas vesicle protein GvpO [Nitriliruptor alkaliphilus]
MSYDDRTKAELQDELRDRDLPVSGSKQDLIDRLEEADEEADADESNEPSDDEDQDRSTSQGASSSDGDRPSGSGGRKGPKPLALARLAARQLEQVSGRRVDGVSGIERTEEGWRVGLDLVESARIPPSTDVLGAYEVIVDDDGDLVRYERLRRFIRAQAGDDS